jgi:hypothetical protein
MPEWLDFSVVVSIVSGIGIISTGVVAGVKWLKNLNDPNYKSTRTLVNELSKSLEDRYAKNKTEHKEVMDKINKIDLKVMRLELKQMMDDNRDKETILGYFQEYKELGGNFYMDGDINRYFKEKEAI